MSKKEHIPETCAKKDEKGTHVESQQPDVQIDNFVRDVTMAGGKPKSWVRRNLLDIIHSQRKEAVREFINKLENSPANGVNFSGGRLLSENQEVEIKRLLAEWEESGK